MRRRHNTYPKSEEGTSTYALMHARQSLRKILLNTAIKICNSASENYARAENNSSLTWPFGELTKFLTYKAKSAGVPLRVIGAPILFVPWRICKKIEHRMN